MKSPLFCIRLIFSSLQRCDFIRRENGLISRRKYATFWEKLGNFLGDSKPLSICNFLVLKCDKMIVV